MKEIPLKIFVIDKKESSAEILTQTLRNIKGTVLSVTRVNSLSDAVHSMLDKRPNTIFIDPISLGLDEASDFIFDIRRRFPSIVFVLYVDFSLMEKKRSEFFSGERRRFGHYYQIDKLTPSATFSDEVKAIIETCQLHLSYILKDEEITKLQNDLMAIQPNFHENSVNVPLDILEEIKKQLADAKSRQQSGQIPPNEKSVFLSYRFVDNQYVEGLIDLLKLEGFEITTGQKINSYIGQAILERIKSCEFFICLMTRADEKKNGTYTTSPWLLEEKGAALAMGKRIVLMVEEGVSDFGGLQGDWQRIIFTQRNFTSAAIQAVEQLKSYSG